MPPFEHDHYPAPVDIPAKAEERPRQIIRLRGKLFRRYLCGAYHDQTGKAANGEAIASALNVLEAQAAKGDQITLTVRFAYVNGEVWLDMGDPTWRAVRVTCDGWSVVDVPPILFRRYAGMAPLPEPVRGGSLREILRFVRVARQEDEVLILTWLVVALVASIPRSILALFGAQGAAKTTTAMILRSIIDPSEIEAPEVPGDPAGMAQFLDHNAVTMFDNVSRIGDWQADMLCRAVTGGSFTKRELYTDGEDVIFSFRRAVLLTSICVPTVAPDLLDRFILVELDRVPESERRREADLWREFHEARPRILGALLDTLSSAMRIYPTLDLRHLPRMADYATWGAAVAEALGYGAERFLAALRGNTARQTEEVLESDPVAQAVRRFGVEQVTWTGTASDLFTRLRPEVPRKGDGWPQRPNEFARRLRVLQATLADVGVNLSTQRDGKARTRTLSIRYTASQQSTDGGRQLDGGRQADDNGSTCRPPCSRITTPLQEMADEADDNFPLFRAQKIRETLEV